MYQSRLHQACELGKVELIRMFLKRAAQIEMSELGRLLVVLAKNNHREAFFQVFEHVCAHEYRGLHYDEKRTDLFLKAAIKFNRLSLLKGIIEKQVSPAKTRLNMFSYALELENWEMAHALISSDIRAFDLVDYPQAMLQLKWYAFSPECKNSQKIEDPNPFSPLGILNHIIDTHFSNFPEQKVRIKLLYAAILANDEELVVRSLGENLSDYFVFENFTYRFVLASGRANIAMKLNERDTFLLNTKKYFVEPDILRAILQNNISTIRFCSVFYKGIFNEIDTERLAIAMARSKSFDMIQSVFNGLFADKLPEEKRQSILEFDYLGGCIHNRNLRSINLDLDQCYEYVKQYDFPVCFLNYLFERYSMKDIEGFLNLPNCPINTLNQDELDKLLLRAIQFGDLQSIEYVLSRPHYINFGPHFDLNYDLNSGLVSHQVIPLLLGDARFNRSRVLTSLEAETIHTIRSFIRTYNIEGLKAILEFELFNWGSALELYGSSIFNFLQMYAGSSIEKSPFSPDDIRIRKHEILKFILRQIDKYDMIKTNLGEPRFTTFNISLGCISSFLNDFETDLVKSLCLSKRFGLPNKSELGALPVLTFSPDDSFDYLSKYIVQLLQLMHAFCEIFKAYEEGEHPNLIDMQEYYTQVYLAYKMAKQALGEKIKLVVQSDKPVFTASSQALLFSSTVSSPFMRSDTSLDKTSAQQEEMNVEQIEFREIFNNFEEAMIDRIAGAKFRLSAQ